MSTLSIEDFLAYLRRDDFDTSGDPLAPVAQLALSAAQAHAEQFLGVALVDLADSDGDLPADITQAIYMLARVEFDSDPPDSQQVLVGRAQSVLRNYRRDVGIAGGAE